MTNPILAGRPTGSKAALKRNVEPGSSWTVSRVGKDTVVHGNLGRVVLPANDVTEVRTVVAFRSGRLVWTTEDGNEIGSSVDGSDVRVYGDGVDYFAIEYPETEVVVEARRRSAH